MPIYMPIEFLKLLYQSILLHPQFWNQDSIETEISQNCCHLSGLSSLRACNNYGQNGFKPISIMM